MNALRLEDIAVWRSCRDYLPGPGNCEKIAKTHGVGGRASPRATTGAGLPDNRLARTIALPIFSQLPGVRGWPGVEQAVLGTGRMFLRIGTVARNLSPLPNGQNLVRFDVLQHVDRPTGPAEFQAVDARRFTQTKMCPEIVL